MKSPQNVVMRRKRYINSLYRLDLRHAPWNVGIWSSKPESTLAPPFTAGFFPSHLSSHQSEGSEIPPVEILSLPTLTIHLFLGVLLLSMKP
ncbi:hypothetical protein TNIN_46911 [Trichonephila inaurata madagascariensis]|uniref:Uncharacterized protein n=1 Tax=Trichonephila inaurata madagascariensis TaxID=2747483 RepID=A0A8X7CP77_9ARAC|nr:hypothetical protein TNIN_46911 [Trichonephila inaurata madagascariensis]